jgi:hypothetical protein
MDDLAVLVQIMGADTEMIDKRSGRRQKNPFGPAFPKTAAGPLANAAGQAVALTLHGRVRTMEKEENAGPARRGWRGKVACREFWFRHESGHNEWDSC